MIDAIQEWFASFDVPIWLVLLGLIGQTVFFTRFLVQWIASERAGRSVVPVAFWWLSIVGSLLLFTYAVLRRDPVFMIGQSMGSIIYFRNLMLIAKERRRLADLAADLDDDAEA